MSTQECEICGGPYIDNVIYILPIKKPDGSYDTMACRKCALKSNVYCQKHDLSHRGCNDGTTFCQQCVFEKSRRWGKKIFDLLLKEAEKSKKKEAILKAIEVYRVFSDNVAKSPLEENFSNFIIAYSLRKHQKNRKTIKEMCQKGPQICIPDVFLEEP
jgi:hypothetical protein